MVIRYDDPKLLAGRCSKIGRSLIEVCKLYHGKGDAIIDRIELRGREHFEKAHAKGKGVIFLTGHCGNWELVALASAESSTPAWRWWPASRTTPT
jgi:KDO2-lipid IV(A) lauroyltransferase